MTERIEYRPPIKERDDLELVAIAHSSTDNWQQAAIDQAKIELANRGISLDQQLSIIKKWEEDARQDELKYQEQLKINATEKYSFAEMLFVVFFTPLILTGKIHSNLNLRKLYLQNYKIKFKQRLILLFLGVGLWFGIFYCITLRIDKKNAIQIEKADISTWEKNRIRQNIQ